MSLMCSILGQSDSSPSIVYKNLKVPTGAKVLNYSNFKPKEGCYSELSHVWNSMCSVLV